MDAVNVCCAAPSEVGLAADQVTDVEVLWATPSLSSAAAIGGHLLVMLTSYTAEGPLRETFGLLADIRDIKEGTDLYVALGLTGGFSSSVVRDRYETVLFRYQEEEGRDVRRFRWNLTEAQKVRFLRHLDELSRNFRRPYYFLNRNCGELIVMLARAMDPSFSVPQIAPPDLVISELVRRGWLTPQKIQPRDLSAQTRARLLADRRNDAAHVLCGRHFPDALTTNDAKRDHTYLDMLNHVRQKNEPACWRALWNVLLVSQPLELSRRPRIPDRDSENGFEAALIEARAHVDALEQDKERADVAQFLETEAEQRMPVSESVQQTPYAPMSMGLESPLTLSQPMLFVQRDGISIERAQPRAFAPVRGIDLKFLSMRLASGVHDERLLIRFEHVGFSFRYTPEDALPGLRLGLYGLILEGEHRFWQQTGDIRWLEFGVSSEVLGRKDSGVVLDLSGGLAPHTFYGSRDALRLELPLRAHLALYPKWPFQTGVIANLGLLPSYSSRGRLSVGSETRLDAWLYLGRVFSLATRLSVYARWRWDAAWASAPYDLTAGIGLVTEAY